MKKMVNITHWAVYLYFVYLFGYSSLYKVFLLPKMVNGMEQLGFNVTWTILIGWAEALGWLGLLAGFRYGKIKNAAVLFLFPFAVGALMVHFAHHEYKHFYGALFGCLSSIFLLTTDRQFRIQL